MTSAPRRSPPTPDQAVIDAYWARCVEELGLDTGQPTPVAEWFGDHVEMADELAELVIHGPKRATAGAIIEFEHDGEPLPAVGEHWIVLDGRAQPVALLQTTQIRIGPLTSVDEDFARDEGEGDRTRDWWVPAHREFFARYLPTVPLPYDPDLEMLFERFALVHVAATGPVDEPVRSRGTEPS